MPILAIETFTFDLRGESVAVLVRPHPRARRIGLRIRPGGQILVTLPPRAALSGVERFLRRHADWLASVRKRLQALPPEPPPREERLERDRLHKEALARVWKNIREHNAFYGFPLGRIGIGRQRTRWGSCSSGGNLRFHYKLAKMPERLAEYVVVHELCHLKEMNHSRRFWGLVAARLPDYPVRRSELRGWRG